MLLVTEILERAVYLGATKIHVIPGGSDFTVAFRIAGELVPLASAPISLEPSLVEGVRTFMGLPKPALGQPSVGRLHFEVAGVGVTFSLSAIKALSGWHMVVSVGPGESVPAPLSELGFGEPDLRTLKEIIARRSGLLLIAAPAGEGASDTYYSALSEAISAGRTAFSIEQSIARAVPGAAQVAVAPGSPAAASAYISAALGQDTDVIAIDPVETLTDMRLALEAAAAGKLVVVTFAASSAATAVQRTLRMGVDSASLASALAAIVAQRVVSTVCGACAASDESGVALHLAGNVTGERGRVGAGCSACHDAGNAGRTHLFEVVRATDSVRAAIEAEATAVEFAAVVSAEGMTSFQTDALAKLSAGIVSGSELNRVLHFAG
jgi:general secretion pathway protein E